MNSGVVKQAREFGKSWQHYPLYRRMFTSVASTTTILRLSLVFDYFLPLPGLFLISVSRVGFLA